MQPTMPGHIYAVYNCIENADRSFQSNLGDVVCSAICGSHR